MTYWEREKGLEPSTFALAKGLPSCARGHYELHVRNCDALNIIDLFRGVWAASGRIPAALDAPCVRRAYDHRLREHVVRCGARTLARHVHIPRSTVSTWRRRGIRPVVTTDPIRSATTCSTRSTPALGGRSGLASSPPLFASCSPCSALRDSISMGFIFRKERSKPEFLLRMASSSMTSGRFVPAHTLLRTRSS